MKLTLTRRRFIRGLGLGAGATLLMPMLNRVWAEEQGDMVRRVVFVVTGNGMWPETLMSQVAAATQRSDAQVLALDGVDAPSLQALKGQNGALDLTAQTAVLHGLSSKITGGSHTTHYRALSASREKRQTIDAYMASKLNDGKPFEALRLGVTNVATQALQYNICYASPGSGLPILANPNAAHASLFSSIGSGDASKAFATQAELLAFAQGDVARVMGAFSGGSREYEKLRNYQAALVDVAKQQNLLVSMDDHLKGLADAEGIDRDSAGGLNSAHPMHRLSGQFKLATAALIGQLTNTVVLTNSVGNAFSHTKYTSPRMMSKLGISRTTDVPWRHGVCHTAGSTPEYQAALDDSITWQVEMIADMARRLAAVPEANGTMLDHTAIVFMSDNGDSHHSTAANWPVMLMGGSALGLKTGGRTLLYPTYGNDANRRMANLFNTLGHVAGEDLNDFGGEPVSLRVNQGGPLTDLLL